MDSERQQRIFELFGELLPKNRTIVSRDNHHCLALLGADYPLTLHRFPTGTEYHTWPVPPEWNVRRARLTCGDQVVGSYEESPLFLAPYSTSFTGVVTREELLRHTFSNPNRPESYCYEFRVAYDFQRRLREWRISLPHQRVVALPDGPFEVEIDVETRAGELLVAESSHGPGEGAWFAFLAHYCHIGQLNDGLAGALVMLETMRRLRERFPSPRHRYRALLFPETIGSAIFCAANAGELDAALGAVFTEMPAASSPIQLVSSRRGDTYVDRVFEYVIRRSEGSLPRKVPFRSGWGNDEMVFDSPGVGIPAVSVDRFPFEEYHTDRDDLARASAGRLDEAVELMLGAVEVLERDFLPRPLARTPIYLSRYDLYADWTYERARYDANIAILDGLWSGLSVFDIATSNGLPPDEVFRYVQRLRDHGLIEADPVTPRYTRETRFTPSWASGE